MKIKIAKLLAKSLSLSEKEILNLISIPPSPELGDFAFPCFSLAKEMKKNPIQIAQELAKRLSSNEFEKVEAKGPYVNFFLNKKSFAQDVLKKIFKEKSKYGSQSEKKKIIIEFPGPNTNKPLHIGHARNIVTGQAITNLLKFAGNNVKIVNINNNRGIHICKSMLAYAKFSNGLTPEKAKIKSDKFVGNFYVKFSQALKDSPFLESEAQEMLKKWEAGDKSVRALWKKMDSWALEGFKETYKKFGLKIDKQYYESEIYKEGKKIILDALKNKVAYKKPDGAVAIDLSSEGLGEKILLRSDGTSIYITQDLYLAVKRKSEMKFDRAIYITATEQIHHFKTLFAILKKFGYAWAENLEHVSYGLVNLESGRLKSREGNVVDADDLISELSELALKEIKSRYPELSEKESKSRAESIALSALRYYFLKVDKIRDITFKPEESLKFEGDTGPYLLYTYVRSRSILEKAKYKSKPFKIDSLSESEKSLISFLSNFPEVVANATQNLSPNLIANYSFQLAQKFNEFYHAEKVIGSENESFRLALVSAFAQVMNNSLNLLGINPLERM